MKGNGSHSLLVSVVGVLLRWIFVALGGIPFMLISGGLEMILRGKGVGQKRGTPSYANDTKNEKPNWRKSLKKRLMDKLRFAKQKGKEKTGSQETWWHRWVPTSFLGQTASPLSRKLFYKALLKKIKGNDQM